MNKKLPILLVAIIIAIFLAIAYLAFFQKQAVAPTDLSKIVKQSSPSPSPKVADEILKNALNLYAAKKQAGVDMSQGPCLGKVADDWVLDIAHNPRQPVDDKPPNQCADFREGRVHHFIELDPDGNLTQAL